MTVWVGLVVNNIEEWSDRSPIDKHTILEFHDVDRHHLFVHHLRFIIHCPPFLYVLGVNAFVKFLEISLVRLECIEALCIGAVEDHR